MALRVVDSSRALLRILLLPMLVLSRAIRWLNHLVRLSFKCVIAAFFGALGLIFLWRLVCALGQVLLYPLLGSMV